MIIIIDYGVGNVKSIMNMLRKIGCNSKLSNNIEEIKAANKIILPGVGAFDAAIAQLNNCNLVDILNEKALENKTPILGVCLGLQLMTKKSEEGELHGLGWFDAEVKKFNFDGISLDKKLPIPHMGWNKAAPVTNDPLFKQLSENARFYFVHSYHAVCHQPEDSLASCLYGYKFTCALKKDNIYAVQFHPEKSHKFGMQLLRNFAEL